MINWIDMEKSRYLAAQVKRYHVYPVLREQTIGEHSFNIIQIIDEIFFHHPSCARLMRAALHHDMGEIRSGDIPFGAKKSFSEATRAEIADVEEEGINNMKIKQPLLNKEEEDILKFCDLAEMWLFALQELAMGNRLAQPIRDATEAELNRRAVSLPHMYHTKVEMWRNRNTNTFGAHS